MLLEQSAGAQTVAVYCRVSSEEQAQSGTIQNQGDFAQRYCDLHELKILEVYTDEGVSGVISPFERPASARMLADAKAGRFNTLLVYRLDRLSRSLWHLLQVHEKLQEWGVALRSETEPLDTSTPVGRFVFQLLGSIAELERETIRERTELGRSRALAAGKAMGKPPLGFVVNEGGLLDIDPQEGPLVQEIFTLAAAGTTAGAITRLLDERGVLKPWRSRGYKGKNGEVEGWAIPTILQILRNSLYWSGEWRYERKDGSAVLLPAPVLVDQAMALTAHQQLAGNNFKAKGVHKLYLLSGLIRCAECGSGWTGTGGTGDRRRYYACITAKNKKRSRGRQCDLRPARADLLDATVWADIKAIAEKPGKLAEKIQAKLSQSAEDVEAARRELSAVMSEYDALGGKRLDAQLRSDNGDITREELSAYLRAGAERMRGLERRRLELAERLALRQAEEARVASTDWVRQNLQQMVSEAEGSGELKQQLVRFLVKQVIMSRGEAGRTDAMIDYMYSGPDGSGPDDSDPANSDSGTPITSTAPPSSSPSCHQRWRAARHRTIHATSFRPAFGSTDPASGTTSSGAAASGASASPYPGISCCGDTPCSCFSGRYCRKCRTAWW